MRIGPLLLVLLTAAPSLAGTSDPVLLDFHADWCGPCRQMRPAVQRLERKGYPVKSVDIDRSAALRDKYGVEAVPTFIVVDPAGKELGRTSGAQPAEQLERFYLEAKAKARPSGKSLAQANEEDEADDDGQAEAGQELTEPKTANREEEGEERPSFQNPKPWETVVRIRVLGNGVVGFGSGTVIHSTPEEAMVLTCAHIFKLDGQRQAKPDRFPRKIMVDLFDGKLHGERPAQVHYVESTEGRAVDYDFTLDVGLIRIRPGRRIPMARVVPTHWEPKARFKMLTVGCSEGHDATAWHTIIVNPQMQGLAGNNNYQAIECMIAPKQGRSGGGLFTTDGYVAGVCNFAEPRGDHGLYATPRSIYSMLDRNELASLYAPVSAGSGTLLASKGDRAGRRGQSPITIARAQSPEVQEPRRILADPDEVTLPEPEIVGIKRPASTRRTSAGAGSSTRRMAWHPTPSTPAPAAGPKVTTTESGNQIEQPTDLNIDPAADHDHFSHFNESESKKTEEVNDEDLPSRSESSDSAGSRPRWRAANSSDGKPISRGNDE